MSNTETVYEIKDLKLDQYNISLNEVLFHNANGYIGIRYDFEEGYPEGFSFVPSQYINGFYDFTPMGQAERLYGLADEKQIMLNIANTQSIKIFIDNEQFSMFSGTVLQSKLWLDMDKGITCRKVVWRSPQGKELEITVTRMASFYQLSLFTIEYEVLPLNFSGEILIESGHNGEVFNYADPNDPRLACEPIQYLRPSMSEIRDGASYITSATTRSGLEVCSGVQNFLSQEHQQEFIVDGNNAICQFETEAIQGEKIQLIKYAVFCDSLRYDSPRKQADQELAQALAVPLSALYKKQAEYLTNYWNNCRIEIEGDPELNQATRYSLYQLLQAVGKDRYSNIAPKGVSGDGYEGHYFWDSEMYIQPFFTVTNPDQTRILLEYRYATLELARENARILGHSQGALYPWRTIMGRECSGYFPSGSAQYHINGDIAYAIVTYYLATQDLAFMLDMGAEIIWETARLWMGTGNFYQGKFHINSVTGPDEYTCLVNNNYYTNLVAQYNLRWAVKIHQLLKTATGFDDLTEKISLKDEEIAEFDKAAENMYLPYDDKLKINPQDDSFLQKRAWDLATIPKGNFPLLLHYHPLHLYRHQICKQPDTILAHTILEDAQSEETMYNSFQYYERITTHDSSLSYCIFSVMAARLGMIDKAFAYYEATAKLDLTNKLGNTDDGIHVANMGGNYLAVVYGFGGLRLKEQGISIAPILPHQWTGYSFKLIFAGSRFLVRVEKDQCLISLESGGAINITVYGKEYVLNNELDIDRPPLGRRWQIEGGVPKKYQAVIFDLDGVICSTDKDHYLAWKEIAEEIGVDFDETVNNRLRGIGRMDSLEILLGDRSREFSEEAKQEMAERKNAFYRNSLQKMTPQDLDPEVLKTLELIKAQGIKIAIGSSSKNAKLILRQLGLENYFDAVSDGTNITHSKPDPEVFLKASDYLGIEPQFCLVVEDAQSGLEAAAAANMDCAAIGDALRYEATYYLYRLPDLLLYV